MREGSSPNSMGAKSSTAPTTARVFHSSEASAHPNRPAWSVSTLTNTQLRISALTTTVLMALIFIVCLRQARERKPENAMVDERAAHAHRPLHFREENQWESAAWVFKRGWSRRCRRAVER